MLRIAGLDVRYKNSISDSSMPSTIAISSRIVTVATSVASATEKSLRLKPNSSRQRARLSRLMATSTNSAASAAIGICASTGALKATRPSSSSAENTEASGVRAPDSRLGMERFMEPHDT